MNTYLDFVLSWKRKQIEFSHPQGHFSIAHYLAHELGHLHKLSSLQYTSQGMPMQPLVLNNPMKIVSSVISHN